MEATDLLAREAEFKKLNKELEKKSESLMKQIETAMQKQDIFTEFSHKLTISPHVTPKKHYCNQPRSTLEHTAKTQYLKKKSLNKEQDERSAISLNKERDERSATNLNKERDTDSTKSLNSPVVESSMKINCSCCAVPMRERVHDDLEFLYAFISVSVQEDVLPKSFLKERATVENVCKFLSNKVKLMQEQIDKLQKTINKKASQCENHLTKLAELESERMTQLHRTSSLQAAAAEATAKQQAIAKQLQDKERLYKEQRSAADKLASEAKRLRSKNATIEAKCASQEELIGTLKHQIEVAKRSEKEFRESTRSLSASHQSAISELESRIKTLTTRNSRQMALIDNLRKQLALVLASKSIHQLEVDFNKFLEAYE